MRARRALQIVEQGGEVSAQRLRRPKRCWALAGLFVALLALLPYLETVPVLYYAVVFIGPLSIAIIAARTKRGVLGRIKVSGWMVLQLLIFALIAGGLGGASHWVYIQQGWWWVPLVAAILLFTFTFFAGMLLDRLWARRVSRVGA